MCQNGLVVRGVIAIVLLGPENGAGGNAVDPDMGTQLLCQGLGQHGQSRLSGAVERVLAQGAIGVYVDQVDDATFALAQCWSECLAQEIGGFQVTAHQVIPLHRSGLPDRGGVEAGGIVHQQIQPPPLRQGRLRQLLIVAFIQIRLQQAGAVVACGIQVGEQLLRGTSRMPVVDQNAIAGCMQVPAYDRTDALCAAGNQGDRGRRAHGRWSSGSVA